MEGIQVHLDLAQRVCEQGLERFGSDSVVAVAAREALQGGKRLRAALVLALDPQAHAEALAVEDFHAASLIADDLPCMDDALERRGRSALHLRYGEATALLASYALISSGYAALAGSDGVALAAELTGIEGLVGGQQLDLDGDPESALQTLQRKSGALFELSLALGWCRRGGADLERVRSYGNALGVLFQLLDDQGDRGDGAFNLYDALGAERGEEMIRRCRERLEGDPIPELAPFVEALVCSFK